MANIFINFGDQEFEMNVSLRAAQRICAKHKIPPEQLISRLSDALPEEMAEILKKGLSDPAQAKALEEAIFDGGSGMSHLRTTTTMYLLELAYPGSMDEKETAIEATLGAGEEQKNGLRAVLGLPQKPPLEPSDSGRD